MYCYITKCGCVRRCKPCCASPSVLAAPATPPQATVLATQTFDPSQASGYTQGKLLQYNGAVYVVGKNNPSGTPGSSPDFIRIAA